MMVTGRNFNSGVTTACFNPLGRPCTYEQIDIIFQDLPYSVTLAFSSYGRHGSEMQVVSLIVPSIMSISA